MTDFASFQPRTAFLAEVASITIPPKETHA